MVDSVISNTFEKYLVFPVKYEVLVNTNIWNKFQKPTNGNLRTPKWFLANNNQFFPCLVGSNQTKPNLINFFKSFLPFKMA